MSNEPTPAEFIVEERASGDGIRSVLHLQAFMKLDETTGHLVPEYAALMDKVTTNQFIRPAEEETKRESARQRWATVRTLISEGRIYLALGFIGALVVGRYYREYVIDGWLIGIFLMVLGADRIGLGELAKRILNKYGQAS